MIRIRMLATALILVLAALIANGYALVPGGRMNPVGQAGLRATVKIEVAELNTWEPGDESYAHLVDIADPQAVDELVNALDTNLRTALKVQCIPSMSSAFNLKMAQRRRSDTVATARPSSVGGRTSGRVRTSEPA